MINSKRIGGKLPFVSLCYFQTYLEVKSSPLTLSSDAPEGALVLLGLMRFKFRKKVRVSMCLSEIACSVRPV